MGRNGFLGSEIAKKLHKFDTTPNRFSNRIFFFGSPSSVILFNKNLDYCFRETINSFIEVCSLAKQNNIYIVPLPLIIKNNSYARCKAALEEIRDRN